VNVPPTTPDDLTHPWDITPTEAIALQKRLASQVIRTNTFDPDSLHTVAGIDVSLKDQGQAAIVVLSLPDLTVVDRAAFSAPITFPYVPGLLSFRETPLVLAALKLLKTPPDLLMVDGQGIAHPRRFGIACHVGLLANIPSIGVGKSVLTGRYENLGDTPGDQSPLTHRGETIGIALRAKLRTNPLIISIGHKIDLETAVAQVQRCLRGYRLPEPTRQAHNYAALAESAPNLTLF